MNKFHRSIWSAHRQATVVVAENVSARGKPGSGAQVGGTVSALLGTVVGSLLGLSAQAQTPPPPTTLPTGGQVSAGQAAINQAGAQMVIQQGSERAAINWQSFNVGQDAHVQFNQPSAASVTLNRVMSADPSQIFGRISANGQVVLTNPQGVYFGRDARVDVGGLVATTNTITDADFMAGNNRYRRNGSTAAVVNEGELKAALGGYIALLAPEVRNYGAVIAQMGTVALVAGEAVDLHFDSNNRLTSIRVDPALIKTLVENHRAVQAPGGLIIVSSQSMDRLVGGVVNNDGSIEANGMHEQGGRIVLSASSRVNNSGTIAADARVGNNASATAGMGIESGPAGQISLSAPTVINSGVIRANGSVNHTAGNIAIDAEEFEQRGSGSLRATAAVEGGSIAVTATGTARIAGEVSVAGVSAQATGAGAAPPARGGEIVIAATRLTLDSAMLDASGDIGGTLRLRATSDIKAMAVTPGLASLSATGSGLPATILAATGLMATGAAPASAPAAPSAPVPGDPREPSHLAVLGTSSLSVRGRRSQGGVATLSADHIALQDHARIDATGETGGGAVLVGGDWQGGHGANRVLASPDALHQATTTRMESMVAIDASAGQSGNGGTVVLWSDVHNAASVTSASGTIAAKGGTTGGNGGRIETSGRDLHVDGLSVSTQAAHGATGNWLLDPYNITISTDTDANTTGSYSATGNAAVVNVNTLQTALASSNVTVFTGSTGGAGGQAGDITVANAISAGGTNLLTLDAAGSIVLNAGITRSGMGGLALISGTGGLSGTGNMASTGGNLAITQAGNSTYQGIISGTGATLAKYGTGSLTFTANNTYTGNTTIDNGVLVLSNNAPNPANRVFSGSGQLRIEPTAGSFSSGFTTTGWTFANTLSGLTLGKPGNTQNMTMAVAQSLAGPISVYGGNIAVNSNLTTTAAGAGILLKSSGNIVTAANTVLQTNAGGVTLWGDSDASGDGFILLTENTRLDSRRTADRAASNTTTASGGGAITLGGGNGASAAAGYASNNGATANRGGVNFGDQTYNNDAHTNLTTLYSGGGEIAVRASSSTNMIGLNWVNGGEVNAGTGTVLLDAQNTGSGHAIELASWRSTGTAKIVAAGGAPGVAAIAISGTTNSTGGSSGITSGSATLESSGAGGIALSGISGTAGKGISGSLDILAASGPITLNGGTAGISTLGTFGKKAGSGVSLSSSDVSFTGDSVVFSAGARIDTSGKLVVQPFGNSFNAAQVLPVANLALEPSVSALTFGKPSNTANVTVSSAINIAGPITIYGGNVALNAGLNSSATTGGNIFVQARSNGAQAGIITLNTPITKISGGDATLTLRAADSIVVNAPIASTSSKLTVSLLADNDNGAHDGVGAVLLNNNVTTNGGAISFGNDDTIMVNGASIKVGGDVYVGTNASNNANSIALDTRIGGMAFGGGAVAINGEMLVGNSNGFDIASGGGNVLFGGLLNSGNTYNYVAVASNNTWGNARNAARSGAGDGSKPGDTYLATITSRLENAIAGSASNYATAWLGGSRGGAQNAALSNDWYWVTGPEGLANAARGTLFYNQTSAQAGTTPVGGSPSNGAYVNWNINGSNQQAEPNSTNEPYLQFDGSQGRWNDLSATSTAPSGYVRETNLVASRMTIDAGSGTVTFQRSVGSQKALGNLNVTAGSIAVTGGTITTEGSQTYNGNVALLAADVQLLTKGPAASGYDILFNDGVTKSGAGDIALTVKAHRDILLKSDVTASAGKLNMLLEADVEDNGSSIGHDGVGFIQIDNNVATNGGAIQLGSGATTVLNGDTVQVGGDLYVAGTSAQTFSTGGGVFLVNGETLLANVAGLSVNTSGAAATFNGIVNSANAFSFVPKVAGVNDTWMLARNAAKSGSGGAVGETYLATVTSRVENAIAIRTAGYLESWLGGSRGGAMDVNASSDWYWVTGPEGLTNGGRGQLFYNQTQAQAVATPTSGSANNGAYVNWNVNDTNQQTEPNNAGGSEPYLQFRGSQGQWNDLSATSTAPLGYVKETNLAPSALRIDAGSAAVTFNGAVGGTKPLETITVVAGSTAVNGAALITTGSQTYNNALSVTSIGDLRVGATTIGLTNALQTLLLKANGNIAIDAGLVAATGGTITLQGSGNVSDGPGGFVSVDKLLLSGGNVTLDGTGNNVGTLAATGVANLSYINSGALTLGTVGAINGVAATGIINIGTRTGDLTLAQNVGTTNAGASAIVLNAGINAVAGTASGGNIVVSGSPSMNVGAGGTARLFSGSVPGSSGLTALIGSGSGRFRYNSDEAATNYADALGSGTYAIYRERPTAAFNSLTLATVYGDAMPGIDSTGFVNGDDLLYTVTGRTNASSGNIRASASPYGITTNVSGLGYDLSGPTSGTLSVAQRTLSISGFASANKLYDGTTAAMLTSAGSATGIVTGDSVSVFNGSAAFDNPNAGTGKTVTLTGIGLTGTDSSNYNIASATTATATIGKASLGITTGAVTKTYDGTRAATGTASVSSGTLYNNAGTGLQDSLSGGTFTYADKNASLGKTVSVANVTINDGNGGNNYSVSYLDNTTSTINQAALTVSGTIVANKSYDGNTSAMPGNGMLAGVFGGDAVTLTQTGSFADKNVGTAKAVSVSNVITGADASNYTVAQTTGLNASIAARILSVIGLAASNKTYDGTDAVDITDWGTVDTGIATETLTLGHGTASFDNAGAATNKVVTGSGYFLTNGAGGAATNYALSAPIATASADIVPRQLTLSAAKIYDGSTSLTGAVTLGNLVGAQTLLYTGATASDTHVVTPGKTIAAIALADGSNGGLAANYRLPTLDVANAPVTIAAATLVPVLANPVITRTYTGTTDAPVGFMPQWLFNGLAPGDTAATLSRSTARFNDATVSGATMLTVGGLSIDSINGSNGSFASDYVLDATSKSVAASITPASLLVSANNDARFVTQPDAAGFAGVSYAGWVNGESDAVLGGTPVVTRNNPGIISAGIYTNELQPGGLSAANYSISYAPGTYTIVPANQLLVKVASLTNTYASPTTYAVTEARYLSTDETTIVDLLPGMTAAGNNITIDDGSGGRAMFSIVPGAAATSSAGFLKVGNYALVPAATSSTSNNFSNNLVLVGNHSVVQKGITATATGVSKVYDGNTSMTAVSLGLTGKETGDLVTIDGTGAFSSKNVGTNLNYNISDIVLTNADAANYYLTGNTSLAGTDGVITPRSLRVNYSGVDKVYDGNATATVITSDDRVAGDALSLTQNAIYLDKNVAPGKVINITDANIGGIEQGNYMLASTTGTTAATISRLDSVAWTGPATGGNWFDPANWTNGAVPDLANVANVVIAAGFTPVFGTTIVTPAQNGPVSLDGIGTGGSLIQNGGTLNLGTSGMVLDAYTQTGGILSNGGTTTLDSFTQSGGSFAGTGNITAGSFMQTGGTTVLANDLTVTRDFSQGSSGSASIGGTTQITDTVGGVQLGNLLSSGPVTVISTDGTIVQAPGTAISAQNTSGFTASRGGNPADVTLINAGNAFTGPVSLAGATVQITDADALTLGTVTATGNLTVNSTGNLDLGTSTVGGALNANSGNGNITQSGALRVVGGSTLNAGTGRVALSNPANNLSGGVTIVGATSTVAGDFQGNVAAAEIVGTALNSVEPIILAPGTGSLSNMTPQGPVLGVEAAGGSINTQIANTAGTGGTGGVVSSAKGSSAGVIVALADKPGPNGALIVAVSLPKGVEGSGFSFVVPTAVRELFAAGAVQASLPDGTGLPVWLRFDAKALRFDAAAAPAGAIPIEVLLVSGDKRVRVVISERKD